MKIKFPNKSILGFGILNYTESIFSSYLLLLFSYLYYSRFGYEEKELIAGYSFLIISNMSLLILLINALSKIPKIINYKNLLVLPLLIHSPLSFIFIFKSIIKLYEIVLLKKLVFQ